MDKKTVDAIVQAYRRELETLPYTAELINRMVGALKQSLYRSYDIPRSDA